MAPFWEDGTLKRSLQETKKQQGKDKSATSLLFHRLTCRRVSDTNCMYIKKRHHDSHDEVMDFFTIRKSHDTIPPEYLEKIIVNDDDSESYSRRKLVLKLREDSRTKKECH